MTYSPLMKMEKGSCLQYLTLGILTWPYAYPSWAFSKKVPAPGLWRLTPLPLHRVKRKFQWESNHPGAG